MNFEKIVESQKTDFTKGADKDLIAIVSKGFFLGEDDTLNRAHKRTYSAKTITSPTIVYEANSELVTRKLLNFKL